MHPAEDAVGHREQVEGAEQAEHDEGRPPRRPPVGVGVEADDDVGQPHRAEEGRKDE